ncbi:MAG: hypothetical protein HYX27_11720 [Acidobacteria bacterium]|nr:hypothetical protein [Acidobacteriota bacterium]
MQTLGLDGAPPPEPWYKLWVWPDVAEPEAAVGAARNGAIGAVAIGAMTCVIGTIANGPGALLDGGFYLLAAIGIRQLSFPASAMAVVLYIVSQITAMTRGQAPGIIGLALSLLLIGALRASWRAVQMSAADRAAMANDSPLDTWTQRAFQKMASPLWRKIRILFNVIMLIYFAILMTGLALLALRVI